MTGDSDESAASSSAAVLGQAAGVRRSLPELQDSLFLDLGDVRRKMSRFWILLTLSAVIAGAGILADSTATVIGAMIVAPLGTPLMGIALAVVIGNGSRLWKSAAIALGGTVVVILVGAFLAWLFPKLQPLVDNGQITARTSPGVIDLVAAVATGVAGSYGIARRDVASVMPGVAIAISLVPPLAVVGITAADGNWSDALGAFVLFAANVLAVVLAGTVVLTLCGYGHEARTAPGFRRTSAYAVIATSLLLILAPLGITTAQAAREQIWLDRASAIARAWAARSNFALQDVSFEGSRLNVVIEGVGPGPSTAELLRRLRDQLPAGTAVVLDTINGSRTLIGHVPSLPSTSSMSPNLADRDSSGLELPTRDGHTSSRTTEDSPGKGSGWLIRCSATADVFSYEIGPGALTGEGASRPRPRAWATVSARRCVPSLA